MSEDSMPKSICAAVIQHTVKPSVSETHDYLTEKILDAKAQGAQLIVLQELHNGPYFCQTENVDEFDRAEPIPGPSTNFFAELAKKHECVLVCSLFEKRATGLYHNTAVVLDSDGSLAGYYRKMHIPDDPGFYEKFYFTPGDASGKHRGFKPIQTSIGKLGVLVCWDQWYPEAARLMALAGADLLVYPTAIGWDPNDDQAEQNRQLDAWQTIQRSHAIANGLPLIVPNRVGKENSPDKQSAGIKFWGNSFICGPQGEYLAKAGSENEEVLIANIDYKKTEDTRRIWPFMRDRRVDAYQNLDQRYLD